MRAVESTPQKGTLRIHQPAQPHQRQIQARLGWRQLAAGRKNGNLAQNTLSGKGRVCVTDSAPQPNMEAGATDGPPGSTALVSE